MSTFEQLEQQWRQQAEAQEAINEIAYGGGLVSALYEGIREAALAKLSQYAQYADYFAEAKGWRLGVIVERIETKGGVRFERDDVVLWREYTAEERAGFGDCAGERLAYSLRGQVGCAIGAEQVRALATTFAVAGGLVRFEGVAS